MHTFKTGPALHLHVSEEPGFTTKLTASDTFCVTFSSCLSPKVQKQILTWMEGYGVGAPPSIDFLPRQNFPSFTAKVLDALFQVPFGKVVTYSELAHLAGSPDAHRAVGTICRKNPFPLFIPCHRVIRSCGEKGGFAFGSFLKTVLLEFESSIPSQDLV